MKTSDVLQERLSRIVLLLLLAGGLSSAFCQTITPAPVPKAASEPSAQSALAGSTTGSTAGSASGSASGSAARTASESIPAGKSLVLIGPFELQPHEMKTLERPEQIDTMLSMARSAWNRTARTQQEVDRIPPAVEESLAQLIVSKMKGAFPSLSIARMELAEWQSFASDPEGNLFSGSNRGADFMAMVFYAFQQEDEINCIIGVASRSGETAVFESGWQSIFAMSDSVQKLVEVLGSPAGLASLAALRAAPKTQTSQNEMVQVLSRLPESSQWPQREQFRNASANFKTSFGASILSLCATILSAGTWQAYQEASVRNPAFQTGALISGIATGGTATVTIAFLAAAVWNAVIMLQTAQ